MGFNKKVFNSFQAKANLQWLYIRPIFFMRYLSTLCTRDHIWLLSTTYLVIYPSIYRSLSIIFIHISRNIYIYIYTYTYIYIYIYKYIFVISIYYIYILYIYIYIFIIYILYLYISISIYLAIYLSIYLYIYICNVLIFTEITSGMEHFGTPQSI